MEKWMELNWTASAAAAGTIEKGGFTATKTSCTTKPNQLFSENLKNLGLLEFDSQASDTLAFNTVRGVVDWMVTFYAIDLRGAFYLRLLFNFRIFHERRKDKVWIPQRTGHPFIPDQITRVPATKIHNFSGRFNTFRTPIFYTNSLQDLAMLLALYGSFITAKVSILF